MGTFTVDEPGMRPDKHAMRRVSEEKPRIRGHARCLSPPRKEHLMSTILFRSSSKLVGAAALALVAAACSTSTTETNVWKSPTYAGGPMKNVAVFAGRVNATDRRTLEDGYVAALGAYGRRATPSYARFPGGQVPQDQAAVRTVLQQGGYDGAIVSTLKGVTEQILVAPDAYWGAGFYGAYWGPGAPVYAQTDQFVNFETTVWNPN